MNVFNNEELQKYLMKKYVNYIANFYFYKDNCHLPKIVSFSTVISALDSSIYNLAHAYQQMWKKFITVGKRRHIPCLELCLAVLGM